MPKRNAVAGSAAILQHPPDDADSRRRPISGACALTRPPPALVRPSHVALWQQMADYLRGEVMSGAMPPGHRLPPEPQLGALFNVSRITVRKAIEALVQDSVLTRRQGKGTFVTMPVIRHELSELAGIIGSLHSDDIVPQTTLAGFGVAPASPRVADRLGIGDEDVLHYRRVYDLNGTRFGVAEIWLPGATALTERQVEESTAYGILERYLDLKATRAEVVIRAKRPPEPILRALGLRRSSTLLQFERTSRSADGIAREHTVFWVRAESYEFHLTLNGPMPIGAAVRTA